MGCALQTEKGLKALPVTAQPQGALFPDVSSYQGAVNWPAVRAWQRAHGWRPAAIFKMGEYVLDPYASRNASQLRALGFWRAGYWFLRNTGCSHELAQIVAAAHAFGLKVVVLDSEVPEARGYVACLSGALRSHGLIVVVYTGPGTWPGGSNAGDPTWGAAYGPNRPCLPWGCQLVSWQFTDGVYGSPVYVGGLGRVDVSVNLGIENLGAHPTKLVCFGAHAKVHNATCRRVRGEVAKWQRARDASARVYKARACPLLEQRQAWFAAKLKQHPRHLRARRKRALHATRVALRQRQCSKFGGRVTYFQGRINKTIGAYR